VAFSSPAYDELAVAEETAARNGATLHVVPAAPAALWECLPDAVAAAEGLAINAHLPAKFLLSRAIRDAGFKVVLTGEGSDELLAGYAHLRRDLAQCADPDASVAALECTNTVSAGIMLPLGLSLPLDAVRARLGWVPSFLEAKATLGYRMRAVLAPEFLAGWAEHDPFAAFLDALRLPPALSRAHRVDQSLYLWNRSALSNYILRTLGDGTEMAHSVEGRLPFLDHHLFEHVRALPLDLKIRDGVEKYVLREAARPGLTETVYRRQKHPFLAPPLTESLFATAGAGALDRLRDGPLPPFFARERVRSWLEQLPALPASERAAADPVLLTLVCASILQERLCLGATVPGSDCARERVDAFNGGFE
jgi:asparagine synthase (glutamine-hydrolysing)